jgi:hypothetical protein
MRTRSPQHLTHTWDEYLAKNPKAKPYRYKPLPFFDNLDELCSGSTATGERVYVARSTRATQEVRNDCIDQSDSGDSESPLRSKRTRSGDTTKPKTPKPNTTKPMTQKTTQQTRQQSTQQATQQRPQQTQISRRNLVRTTRVPAAAARDQREYPRPSWISILLTENLRGLTRRNLVQ